MSTKPIPRPFEVSCTLVWKLSKGRSRRTKALPEFDVHAINEWEAERIARQILSGALTMVPIGDGWPEFTLTAKEIL